MSLQDSYNVRRIYTPGDVETIRKHLAEIRLEDGTPAFRVSIEPRMYGCDIKLENLDSVGYMYFNLRPIPIEEVEEPSEGTLAESGRGIKSNHLPRGALLYSAPPVTSLMQLDPFQGSYKGILTVTEGKGKKAKTTTRIIAVQKVIYEGELAQVGDQVKEPSYWLPRHNAATVYFPGEKYEVEVAWLLGDYDPGSSGIPAGMHPTPEQIVQWLQDCIDDEYWELEVIKRHLRTPEQKVCVICFKKDGHF